MASRASTIVAGLALGCLLAAWSCGGEDNAAPATPSRATVSAAATATAGAEPGVCDLLPSGDVQRITQFAVQLKQAHNGPGFLNFCTVYLDVPDCQMECALSLEDLGPVDPNSNNTPEAFKDAFTGANPDAQAQFQDGVLGKNSWLATATAGESAGVKLVYFQAAGVAYDLTSPRMHGGVLSADQMIALARLAAENAGR